MRSWQTEIAKGQRFEFGRNWQGFLNSLDDERIESARNALASVLHVDDLRGQKFLDVGGGSGLHSLVARQMGARVHTFDFDPVSVACTQELRRRYFPDDPEWTVEQGSALDPQYLASLGHWDIVYSWGVLHHTGDMWRALDLLDSAVAPNGGRLFIALYNDQGWRSNAWRQVKRRYVGASAVGKLAITLTLGSYFEARSIVGRLLRGEDLSPFKHWVAKKDQRGMSAWTDLVDWVGGYPFEVSKPEEVFDFYRDRGYRLLHLRTTGGGTGCNEFIFVKT